MPIGTARLHPRARTPDATRSSNGRSTSPRPLRAYELRDPGIQLVAHERAGIRRTRTRVWNDAGQQIVLLVLENSSGAEFSNLLSRGRPHTIGIQSRVGWMVTDAGGDTTVGWKADDLTQAWAELTIPAALAGRADDIVHSLRLSG